MVYKNHTSNAQNAREYEFPARNAGNTPTPVAGLTDRSGIRGIRHWQLIYCAARPSSPSWLLAS